MRGSYFSLSFINNYFYLILLLFLLHNSFSWRDVVFYQHSHRSVTHSAFCLYLEEIYTAAFCPKRQALGYSPVTRIITARSRGPWLTDYHFTHQEALGMFFGFKNIRFKLVLAVFTTLCVQRATFPFNKDFTDFKDFYAAFNLLPFP